MPQKANTCAECGSPISPKATICYICRNRRNGPAASKARWEGYHPPIDPPNPSGICQCGCGRAAPIAKQTDVAQGRVKGHACRFIAGHSQRKTVQYVIDPETGCWNFANYVEDDGYGRRSFDGRLTTAHRSFYEALHGPVTPGMDLDHLCRNRACVNPDHLEPVTRRENVMRGKRAKYTDGEAAEVAALLQAGLHYKVIAQRFGCPPKYVHKLAQRHRQRAA